MAASSLLTPPTSAPAFLERAGWSGADIVALAGDASFRRYFRIVGETGTAILMDAPPAHEDCRPFLAVADHLHRLGFAAPRVLARDLEAGLILLEDFGDDRMREALDADPSREDAIYGQAIDLIRDLHQYPAGELPPYDMAVYQREAGLFPDWYMPAVGLDPAPGYAEAWDEVLGSIARDHSVTVLRDYHAENIMLLPDSSLGILDFQDALAGHPAYDLVSLLQDARREVSPELEARMLAHYGPLDHAAYAVLGAQRNAKILGIFTRLWKRDGKPRYLAFHPRIWTYMERDLMHPVLAPVRAWFDANVPAETRAPYWHEPRT